MVLFTEPGDLTSGLICLLTCCVTLGSSCNLSDPSLLICHMLRTHCPIETSQGCYENSHLQVEKVRLKDESVAQGHSVDKGQDHYIYLKSNFGAQSLIYQTVYTFLYTSPYHHHTHIHNRAFFCKELSTGAWGCLKCIF